jgi:hypothetical protein
MLLYIAAAATLLAILALLALPSVGICLTLMARPLIDATWADKVVSNYGLTEIIGVAVPLAILAFAVLRARGQQRFSAIPLLPLWILYGIDVVIFSALLMANEGPEAGANIFFRQINCVAAYYLGQAFFRTAEARRVFFRVLLLATLFPLAIGLFQFVTGYQWRHGSTEGITRWIGLYHDAFTVRYYMMQGILAATVLLALSSKRQMLGRVVLIAYIGCALLVAYRAYSKSAIVTLLCWTILWCLLRRKFIYAAVVCALGSIVAVLYIPEVASQVGQMFHKEIAAVSGQGDLSHTFAGRWYGWYDLLDKWRQLDGLSQVLGSHTAVGAHNDLLMMLMHGGVVGVLLYLIVNTATGVCLVRNALQRADTMALAGLMAFVMWCIDAIGLVPSSYPGYQWFVWAVIGISLRVRADEAPKRRTVTQGVAGSVPEVRVAGPVPDVPVTASPWRGVEA